MDHRVSDLHSPVSRMEIFSNVAKNALLTTQRGMAGYLLSPSIRWFRYQTKGSNFESSDTLYGANDWLEAVENIQYSVFSNSRFYPVALEAIGDALVIGTSYEMVTDDTDNGAIVYDCYSPFECYIAENGRRRVDTFFREYIMTADDAYAKWGDDVPDEVKDLVVRGDGNAECTFVHAIFPRDRAEVADVKLPASQAKRYASVHYSSTGDSVFKVSGYDEFPLAVHRYRLSSGSPYGVSLVDDNLELCMESNDLERKYLKATAKQLDPPIYLPTSLKGRFSQNAGSLIYGDGQGQVPTPIQTVLDINGLAQRIAEVNELLREMLFSNLFNVLMRQDQQRTAYEVQELKGEGLVLLSAIIGNMQEEKLNPLVLRTLSILLKNRMVPEAPDELKKAWKTGRVNVELDGPLAQTMKQYHQTTGIAQGMSFLASWAQIFPESMVNVDADEGMRQGLSSYGMPQTVIREKADVDRIKQQQAQNQQAQAQQQQALVQSQIAKNLGVDAQQMAQAQANSGTDAQQMMQNGRSVG